MRKTIFAFFIMLLSTGGLFIHAEKLATLPDIMKPDSIVIDNDQFYITEDTIVHIYSMKDFKPIKQFGKKGEGPGEFKYGPQIRVFSDTILCNNFGKIMFFSRNGVFQKEKKTASRIFSIYPVGENMVGVKSKFDRETRKSTSLITILNKELESIKVLATNERKSRGNITGKFEFNAVRDSFKHDVWEDKIFIADTKKGFFFEVFDSKGNKLYQIKNEYKVSKVTEEYKKEFKERMESESTFKRFKDRIKIVYAENFPAFRSFMIDNGKLLVYTYKKENNKREVLIMDLKGKLLKTVFLPDEKPGTITKGVFYYLKENEDEEEWELFSEKLI